MSHIISTQIVKPSSPTPVSSKMHKLSSGDQVAPPVYLTFIFFYEKIESNQHHEFSNRLKQSLSETLTIFYPVAGTITPDTLYVDCNDRGAEFIEARVAARLNQFAENPKMEEIGQFLPAEISSYNDDAIQLLVKLNYFDCGGIAVGVSFSHRIGDISCFVTFMNAWAANCRGSEGCGIFRPNFDLALRFPPRESHSVTSRQLKSGIVKKNITTRRLVFDKEKLGKLKKQAVTDKVKDPTTVEALAVFIWQSFIQANKARKTETASFHASLVVNVRSRAAPPLPESTFGNCTGLASAVLSTKEEKDGGEGLLASKLRAAIKAVDDQYVNRVSKGGNRVRGEAGELFKMGNCIFSSWWRFPVYDVDFGWGKPVWVGTTQVPYPNVIVLMGTPLRDGIEAWINVPNDDFFHIIQDNYDKIITN